MKRLVNLRKAVVTLLLPVAIASCAPESETISTTTDTDQSAASSGESASKPSSESATEPANEPIETDAEPSTPVTSSELTPGNYCYEQEQGDVHTYARLSVYGDSSINGSIQHDFPPNGGDVSSIRIDAQGSAEGNTLDVSKRTFSEYDTSFASPFRPGPDPEPAIWEATPQALTVDEETGDRISVTSIPDSDCDRVNAAMRRPVGRNSATYTDGYSDIKQSEVQFDPGAFGTTVSDGLIRGEAALYLVSAAPGQTMSLDISAPEDNAVFQVFSPSGILLVKEERSVNLELPENGTYEIVVGGTRGNASYDLDIDVR